MAVNPYGWSTTAGSNSTVGGVNIAEGCLAANLNGGERAIMAGVKEFLDVISGAKTTGGSGDAQTLTTGLSLSAYAAGQLYGFEAGFTNTATTTLAVDGLTAKTVKRVDGSNLAAGDITAGGIYLAAYESGADVIILLNPTPASAATTVTAASAITDNRIVRGDGGSRGIQESLVVIDDTTGNTYPSSNDLASLGISGTAWSDLFLASGAVINFAASDVTITHSAGLLTIGQALTVTGAIVGSSTFSIGTSNAATMGSIELGAASDTTISRASAGVIQVEAVPLYSNIPQNSQSAAYTTVLADAQKHILHPTADDTARTFTIDSNANVAYPIGTAITFINQINTVTIAITSDTLTLAGSGSTGSRTLAANGIATAIKVASTSWIISGTGLT